jgi:membrane protease YdiL (CAAX protease family)
MPSSKEMLFYVWEGAVLLGGLVLLGRLVFNAGLRRRWLTGGALPPSPLSIADFLMFLWMIVTGGYIAQMIVRLLIVPHLKGLAEADTWETLAFGTSFHFGSLFGCLCFQIYLQKKMLPPPAPVEVWRPSFGGRALAGAVTFATVWPLLLAADFLWLRLMDLLGVPVAEQDMVALFARTQSPWLLGILVVMAVGVAPINEELIFRAGLYRFARGRLPRTAAIVLSAIAFGAVHANLASFLPLTLLGCALALAYEKTGRIEVSMIAHGLFNLNMILFIFARVTNL